MIKIEVKERMALRVIGAAAILCGIGLAFVPYAYRNESMLVMISAYAAVFLIIVSGIGLCIKAANRKLLVEEDHISYFDWIGRKKTFSLDEIGYCKAAFENRGNNDYLKVYDLIGEKLCKLEFDMNNSLLFLQYLIDNRIKIECSQRSDAYLKSIINTGSICQEEIPGKVEHIYEAAKDEIAKWLKKNPRFGVEWKTGIAVYLEDEMEEDKQLSQQKGYTGVELPVQGEQQTNLPEGYLVALEGYLQKEKQFVLDKKNRAVSFYIPLVRVTRSMQVGEQLKIRFFESASEELAEQLSMIGSLLPQNRYHTGELSFNHELYTKLTWKSMDYDV